MTQLEQYAYLLMIWQSKLIEYKSAYELAERQVNFYNQQIIELEGKK